MFIDLWWCNYAQIQLNRPSVIATYNTTMGGTDKFDQLEQYYDDRHRTLHWQLRLILHFLRAAVINAKILFENSSRDKTLRKPD